MEQSTPSPSRLASRRQRQRACDFCRSRKSACLVKDGLPCRLCHSRGRTCTFNYTTNNNAGLQAAYPNSSGAREVLSPYQEPTSDSQLTVQSTQEHTAWDSGVMSAALVVPELLHPLGPDSASGDLQQQDLGLFLLDEIADDFLEFPPELGGFGPAAQDESEPSPQSNGSGPRSFPPVGSGVLFSEGSVWEFAEFTTDMDPYLMRHHPFDASRTWTSKRISIRSVQEGPVPIHFFLRSEPSPENVCPRSGLEELVPSGIGQRLIDL